MWQGAGKDEACLCFAQVSRKYAPADCKQHGRWEARWDFMNLKRLQSLLPWLVLAIYWPMLFVGTHLPRPPRMDIYGKDKMLHFVAYFFLTVLFWVASYGTDRPSLRKGRLYKVVVLFALYGAIDEITQGLEFIGRTCDPFDWVFDICGSLTALLLLFLIRRWLYWLILYWVGLAVITHWPADKPFVKLPEFLQPFRAAYMMTAYLALTLAWWRMLCPQRRFIINKTILVSTLFVLGFYAYLDGFVSMWMRGSFDVSDFLSGLAGIVIGIGCSAALARHNVTVEAYGNGE